MRVGPFEPFGAQPQQPVSAGAPNPAAIGIHGVPRRRFALPVAPPAIVREEPAVGGAGVIDIYRVSTDETKVVTATPLAQIADPFLPPGWER